MVQTVICRQKNPNTYYSFLLFLFFLLGFFSVCLFICVFAYLCPPSFLSFLNRPFLLQIFLHLIKKVCISLLEKRTFWNYNVKNLFKTFSPFPTFIFSWQSYSPFSNLPSIPPNSISYSRHQDMLKAKMK